MDLKEIGINMRNWIDSAQDRDYRRAIVNVALNFRVPYAMDFVRCFVLTHFIGDYWNYYNVKEICFETGTAFTS